MSNSGYWKHKGAQQKFEADKYTKRIEYIMSNNGWTKIRDSTPKEDWKRSGTHFGLISLQKNSELIIKQALVCKIHTRNCGTKVS